MRLPRSIALLAAMGSIQTSLLVVATPAQAAEEFTITASLAGGYSPKDLVIPTGSTVTWRNGEAVPALSTGPTGSISVKHRVVSSDGSIDSGELAPGATFTQTFDKPLTGTYVCKLHPNLMTGSITVEGEPYVPPATEKTIKIVEKSAATSSWGYNPDSLSVVTGTTITWRNTGATPHTVTDEDGAFDSGTLQPGQTYVRTFNKPVAITYYCEPHPWMTATLVVAKPGEKPPVVKPKPDGESKGEFKPPTVIDQPVREGNEPATFQSQIVEGSVSVPDSWGYSPESLSVRAGDTVVWTNAGSIDHTATATDGSFDSGMLATGATFSKTFDSVGTFSYSCTPHPWMLGSVVVLAADATDDDLASAPVPPPGTDAGSPGGPGVGEPVAGGAGGEPSSGKAGPAWSLGNVPLAAGTSAGFLGVGLLFLIPLARELRGAKLAPATPPGVGERGPGNDPELTVEPSVVDLTEDMEVDVQERILVGAGAPLPAPRSKAVLAAASSKTATRKAPAKKAIRSQAEGASAKALIERSLAKKPAAKKAPSLTPAAKKTSSAK